MGWEMVWEMGVEMWVGDVGWRWGLEMRVGDGGWRCGLGVVWDGLWTVLVMEEGWEGYGRGEEAAWAAAHDAAAPPLARHKNHPHPVV